MASTGDGAGKRVAPAIDPNGRGPRRVTKGPWITAPQLGRLANISRRAAMKAAAAAACGNKWRGLQLTVRKVSGRGGQAGTRYEVAVSSLSDDLQNSYMAREAGTLPLLTLPAIPSGPRLTHDQWERQQEILAIIEPAIRPGLTDAERVEAKKAIVAAGHSKSNVYRWFKAYQEHGISGLARLKPSNAGKRRVVASKKFNDAYLAAGHDEAKLPEIDAFVDRTIKGLWKGESATTGEGEVLDLASFMLWEHCRDLGVPVDRELCRVGERRVDQWRVPFEAVAKKNLHAKAFADSLPRIARDWTQLEPMETVIADVKHLDVLVTRPDGSQSYPKLIGFMDGGTGRIFSYLVFCPQRRSITQELVIDAFLAMAKHPEWGLPRQLYLDNGSEFGGLNKIIPALALLRDDDGREIIRAMPYNASAKPIEPLFRRLDQYCFASMTGYTGPNRMDKRTQNVGKAPQAYSKSWEHFCEEVEMLIKYYHNKEVGGMWNASPNDVFRSKLENWRPTFARPLALEMSFCSSETRKLRKEGISFGSTRYHHPELLNVAIGTVIDLLIPWQKDLAPIVTLPDRPPFQLVRDFAYAANDTAGSIESANRKSTYQRSIAKLDREVPTIHPVDVKRRMVAQSEPITIPGRARFLDQGEAAADLARIGAVIEHEPVAKLDEAARRRAREDRITANLLREQARARK